MKGLYVNIPDAAGQIGEMDRVLGTASELAEVRFGCWRIVAAVHPQDWPSGPVYRDPERDLVLAASGWLVYDGRLGNLQAFAEDLLQGLETGDFSILESRLTAGAFVLFGIHRGVPMLVADPFGLHPHYVLATHPFRYLAPSPYFIPEGEDIDPVHSAILGKMDHLVGNLTAYANVMRVDPGVVTTPAGPIRYFRYDRRVAGSPSETIAALRRTLVRFEDVPGILPMDGGPDSRLILACGNFRYGYAVGPEKSGDRPVARRFAGRFQEYQEFSLLDLYYDRRVREVGLWMFDGVCAAPMLELLAVFRRLARRWKTGCRVFDHYGGDVLLRGTFCGIGGLSGSLRRAVPRRFLPRNTALRLLRRRYAKLTAGQFRLVDDAYRRHVADLDLPEMQKAQLFELVYGRGARHDLNGGTIMAGQFFPAVQPYLAMDVYRRLAAIEPEDAVSRRALNRLWNEVPGTLRNVPAYAGWSTVRNRPRGWLAWLLDTGLARTSLLPMAGGFDAEREKVRWR